MRIATAYYVNKGMILIELISWKVNYPNRAVKISSSEVGGIVFICKKQLAISNKLERFKTESNLTLISLLKLITHCF